MAERESSNTGIIVAIVAILAIAILVFLAMNGTLSGNVLDDTDGGTDIDIDLPDDADMAPGE